MIQKVTAVINSAIKMAEVIRELSLYNDKSILTVATLGRGYDSKSDVPPDNLKYRLC